MHYHGWVGARANTHVTKTNRNTHTHTCEEYSVPCVWGNGGDWDSLHARRDVVRRVGAVGLRGTDGETDGGELYDIMFVRPGHKQRVFVEGCDAAKRSRSGMQRAEGGGGDWDGGGGGG